MLAESARARTPSSVRASLPLALFAVLWRRWLIVWWFLVRVWWFRVRREERGGRSRPSPESLVARQVQRQGRALAGVLVRARGRHRNGAAVGQSRGGRVGRDALVLGRAGEREVRGVSTGRHVRRIDGDRAGDRAQL